MISYFSLPFEKLLKIVIKANQQFSLVQKYYCLMCARFFFSFLKNTVTKARPKCTPKNHLHRLWCNIQKGKERKALRILHGYNDCNSCRCRFFSFFPFFGLFFLVNSISFQIIHALTVIMMFHLYNVAIRQRVFLV